MRTKAISKQTSQRGSCDTNVWVNFFSLGRSLKFGVVRGLKVRVVAVFTLQVSQYA